LKKNNINMSSFNEAIERMKSLYTYGNINEDKHHSIHTIEYHQTAADGKSYGIIRECNKYYIKTAPEAKALMAEAYDYIGGICNKRDYEYTNYNSAMKNFELKIASINEAVRGDMNDSVDNFKTKSTILEGSDLMQMEIARQRQIMHNAAMIMNESSEIGADRKNDVVMYDKENPEAPKGGNTMPSNKDAKADPEYKGSNTNGLDKDVTPFEDKVTVKEGCECMCGEKDDWGSEGMCKGEDPKKIGWDIDGQEVVNEEENDWGSEGLPANAGVGEADTDHNDNPFTETINEEEDFDEVEPEEGETGEDEIDLGVEDDSVEDDIDGNDVESEENSEDTFVDDDDIANTEDGEGTDNPEDTDTLDVDIDVTDDVEDVPSEEDEPVEDNEEWEDFDVDLDDTTEDEPTPETENEPEMADDDEFSDFENDENFEADDTETEDNGNVYDDEFEDGEKVNDDDFDNYEDGVVDECGDIDLYESKRNAMNKIIDSVVNEILNEETLHVFGKHPGYRKKPMELPATGEDKNQWGEDWNDESVHSEEPFGSKIGDGTPFDKLVDAVTSVVMEQLKGGKKKMK
jgi:hypothetical protein